MKKSSCSMVVLCLILIWTSGAIAAGVPGTVQPGQIEQQFRPEPKPQADQTRKIAVPAPEQPMPANAAEIRFKLDRLVIEGATVYPESALLPYYRGLVGREVSLSQIYKVAAALTSRYRNDGYILSQVVVPAQSIEDGTVRLKAVEGYVDKIIIDGAGGDFRNLVQRYGEKIKKSRPLKNEDLERYMLLINDLPGAFAQATLKPSQTTPGASDLIIQFSQRKVQGGAGLDNRGGESLGPLRISVDAALNSVLGLQENTSARYVTSGDNKMNFLMISHEELIGTEGGKLNLSASGVNSTPKEMSFIPLNLETTSRTGSAMYTYPLLRSRSENLSVRFGGYAHQGKTDIFGQEDTKDDIRALKLGASYDRADAWYGTNLLDIELGRGISGLGSSKNGDPDLSRPNGKVDFTKATLYAARVQTIYKQWSVMAAVNAQYAFTDLLSSELFSFGGEYFGRGYDPSELVGDTGAAGKVELRYTESPPAPWPFTYTGYVFYDVGIVHQRSAGGLAANDSGASAGFGVRLQITRYLSGFGEFAKPLTREVAAEGNRDPRAYAGFSIRF